MDKNPNQEKVNAAFKTEIKKYRTNGESFGQKASAHVANAVMSELHTPDGTPVELSETQRDIVNTMFYQTSDTRVKVIAAVLKDANVELDKTTEALLRKLFNPAAVEQSLKAQDDPEKKTLRELLA